MTGVLLAAAAIASFQLEIGEAECWPRWFDREALLTMLAADILAEQTVEIRVEIPRCDTQPLQFEVHTRREGETLRSEAFSVDGTPESLRLRVLALIIVEESRRRPPRPERPIPPSWRVGLGMRGFMESLEAPLGGATLGWVEVPASWATWDFELELVLGRVHATLGTVDLGVLATRSAFLFWLNTGPVYLGAGPELELGWAWTRPMPRRRTVVSRGLDGPLGSLGGRIGVQLRPGGAWVMELFFATGATTGGLRAQVQGETVAVLAGPYYRLSLRLAF